MPQVTRDGLSLYYEQEGRGDPPLLFIHGWCCDHTFFQPQVDYFKARHAVTTLDLRGCGHSDRPWRTTWPGSAVSSGFRNPSSLVTVWVG